jgi:carboxyl-terminal processing protease
MSRERVAWFVSVLLLAFLAFQAPGSFAQRDDDYAWVKTLVEVHRQVVNNYVEPVDDNKLKNDSIKGMLSELDPFTIYVPPDLEDRFEQMIGGNFTGVGITLEEQNGKAVVISPIEDSPADHAGIEAGDVIVKVNGASIAGLALDDVVKKVAGPAGSPVTLTVERQGKELSFTMNRQEIELRTVHGYQRSKDDSWTYFVVDNPKIAYVRLSQFDEGATTSTYDELKKVLEGSPPSAGAPATTGLLDQGMKGLILDLRFNPGGRLEQAEKIVNMFVKEGDTIVTTRGRNRPEEINKATAEDKLPYFPMIVLVNDQSASAAEIVSGSLKDNHRALILGQRTYGKGSVQEVMKLDDGGGELKITVAYYYLPSGRLVHRKPGATDWGVEPHIIVPLDEAGEDALRESFQNEETIRKPVATQPATQPTTRPVDIQLQQAMNTMVGLIVLNGGKLPPDATTAPATMSAATQP